MSKKKVPNYDWSLLAKLVLATISVVIIGVVVWKSWPNQGQHGLGAVTRDEFADCLTSNGMIMYGVDTCEYCQNQKKMFGSSFERINYVNCDFDKQICLEKGISGYPVWEKDGKLFPGVKTFDQLEQATGCVAPK